MYSIYISIYFVYSISNFPVERKQKRLLIDIDGKPSLNVLQLAFAKLITIRYLQCHIFIIILYLFAVSVGFPFIFKLNRNTTKHNISMSCEIYFFYININIYNLLLIKTFKDLIKIPRTDFETHFKSDLLCIFSGCYCVFE